MTPTGGSVAAMSYRGVGQSWQVSDGGISYVTGPLGLTKWSNGTTTEYVIRDPLGNPVAIMQAGGQDYYLMTDKNGSITTMVGGDGGADPGAQYSYGPWGNVTGSYDYGPPIPLGFDGGLTDPPGGLIKFGERYYDPHTGRWTQQDPIGGSITEPTSSNGYIYAGDNPTNFSDPTGLSCYLLIFGSSCTNPIAHFKNVTLPSFFLNSCTEAVGSGTAGGAYGLYNLATAPLDEGTSLQYAFTGGSSLASVLYSARDISNSACSGL